jgi:transposase
MENALKEDRFSMLTYQQLLEENGMLREQARVQQEQIAELKKGMEELAAALKWQQEKYAALERRVYGASSERLREEELKDFLPGMAQVEGAVYAAPEVVSVERKVYPIQRTGGVRANIPEHIERVEVEVTPPVVQENPAGYEKIGEDVSERLDYLPGKIICKRYRVGKYKDKALGKIIAAAVPPTINEKCLAEPGLVAHVILQKYDLHLPAYRQAKHFQERHGIELHRNVVLSWIEQGASGLDAIYQVMRLDLQRSDYLQMDETPIRYLDPDIKGRTGQGYLWIYGQPASQVIFEWKISRSREGPEVFLENFHGYAQSDGYIVYESLAKESHGITWLACWAHVRRKFFEAKDSDTASAWFLAQIGQLYDIERELRHGQASAQERQQARAHRALPILAAIKTELDKARPGILPKSLFGQAVEYASKLWPRLIVYATNGILEIDQNLCENAIRPTAIGKKNWLFVGHPEAGDRSAILYSLIISCRRLGINPHEYLTDVIVRLPTLKVKGLEQLRPLTPLGWAQAKAAAALSQSVAA